MVTVSHQQTRQRFKFLSSKWFWLGIVLVGLGTAVLWSVARQKLTAQISSPEFKQRVEGMLAKRIAGTATIEHLEAHIGWQPWITVHQVNLSTQDKHFSLSANRLRLNVRLMPLWHGRVELPELLIEHPRLVLRRPKQGRWKELQLPSQKDNTEQSSQRLESIVIRNGEIVAIDEALSSEPIVLLRGDAHITESEGGMRLLSLNAKFEGFHHEGTLQAEGQLSEPQSLRATLKATHRLFPLKTEAVVDTTGPLTAKLSYISTGTTLAADVGGDWLKNEYQIRVKGARLLTTDIERWLSWRQSLPKQKSMPSNAKVSVQADCDIAAVQGGLFQFDNVRGSVKTGLKNNRLVEFQVDLSAQHFVAKAQIQPENQRIQAQITSDALPLLFTPSLREKFKLISPETTTHLMWSTPLSNPRWDAPFSPLSAWTLHASAKEFLYKKVEFKNVSAQASWDGNRLNLSDVKGNVSSGTLSADAIFADHTADGFQTLETDIQLDEIDVEPIMTANFKSPFLLSGRLSAQSRWKAVGNLQQVANWSGAVTAQATSGELGVHTILLQVFERLNLKSLLHIGKGSRDTGLPFDVATASATLHLGRILVEEPAILKSKTIDMIYTGWLTPDGSAVEGTLVMNPLMGSKSLLSSIPVVSGLVMGPNGEFLPLIVDLKYESDKLTTNFRSVQTLTETPLQLINNILARPANLFRKKKKI